MGEESQRDKIRIKLNRVIYMKSAFFLLVLIFGFFMRLSGQDIKVMNAIESDYQHCLDNGENMLGCSKVYYTQMDSMLNRVYNKLRKQLSTSEFSTLKSQQISWIANRDRYFKSIKLSPEEKELPEEDQQMVIIDKKADFVRNRVLELIKLLK